MLDSKEHQSCYYYGNSDKPAIDVLKLALGETGKLAFLKNKIAFVINGGIQLTYRNDPEKNVEKGKFFFIPSGVEFGYIATGNCSLLIVRIQDHEYLCEGCRLEHLLDGKSCNNKPVTYINTLTINKMLWNCIYGLKEAILEGFNCRHYLSLKAKEIITIIRSLYTRSELQKFFSPVLSSDIIFSEQVRKNYHKYKTVGELANSMNMTSKHFTKKFAAVFGMTPLQWVNQEKAQRIYNELIAGSKTLGQIADEYEFRAQAHLNKFCKREFGKNPGEIRKGVKTGV